MNEVNLKGSLQVCIEDTWLPASLVAADKSYNQVCLKVVDHGLTLVDYKDVRNKPEVKTAGLLWKLVHDTAFEKQETAEQSATRFIKLCVENGLTKCIDKV